MRDPNRLDVFYEELKNLHKENFPDLRFLQLMMDYIGWIIQYKKQDPFFAEESKCIELFKEYMNNTNPFFKGSVLYDV